MITKKQGRSLSGGANCNVNGLAFEDLTDLESIVKSQKDIDICPKDFSVYEKHGFLRYIKSHFSIDIKKILSKKLLPDSVVFNHKEKTIVIIEKKFQASSGSVDEKLQTCDFKKKQYEKLLIKTKYKVSYLYVLNDWFSRPEYKDTLSYIESVDCGYFIYENNPLKLAQNILNKK